MLHELPSAARAVEQSSAPGAEGREGIVAIRAGEAGCLGDWFEPELPSTACAVQGLGRVHEEAIRAPDRRDGGFAIRTLARELGDAPTALRTRQRARLHSGHRAKASGRPPARMPGTRE